MPRSLVSYWKRVATSGPTADGREITPQELRDCAETYKPAKYTAVIWAEHERWSGAHGTVFSVRLIEDDDPELEPGQVALEAQLKPNDRLLWLNDQGQKLFSSVEITPNFANSGRAYLTGLAVTDEPASLGTQELYFSRKTSKAAYYAASVPLGSFREPKADSDMGGLITALTGFFKRFSASEDTTPETPTPEKTPMDEATAKALKALLDQLLIVAAGIQAVLEPAAEDVDETDTEDQVDAVEEAVQEIVEQAEEEREFSRRNKGLSARVVGLEQQLTKLLNTSQGRQIPRTTGTPPKKPARKLR